MVLMPVVEAQAHLLALARSEPEVETVSLTQAAGRVLTQDVFARHTQPPFPASAMDGYAVRVDDLAVTSELKVIGGAAAGRPFAGSVKPGEAVRIFTGAPVPAGADTILIQENAEVVREGVIRPTQGETRGRFVRPAGLDFAAGDIVLTAGGVLDARKIGLAAAAGHATVSVARRPRIGVLSTGDELVMPGEPLAAGQIVSSNGFAVCASVEAAGGEAIDLGIARDTRVDLDAKIDAALAARCDVLVTLGGASVGDHDLVQPVLSARGMNLSFWKIAMRPGKPMMLGQLGDMIVLGLPGNPVSAYVCSILFLQPLIRAMLGQAGDPRPQSRIRHARR